MSKVNRRILISLVVLSVLALLAYPKWKSAHSKSSPGMAKSQSGSPSSQNSPGPGKGPGANGPGATGPGASGPPMPPLPVTAKILQAKRMEDQVTSTGTVMANEEVEIRSEIQGKVKRISFREGGQVKKGDLLVKIDDEELQANVLKALSQRKLAEDNEYRMKMQLKIEAVSQKDYDQALNELNLAKAGEQLLRAQLAKTELRAPFSGMVGLKNISEGALVSGTTSITSLQEINPIKIDFSVPGKYADWIKVGMGVTYKVQGIDANQVGKIYAIDPKIDPETRTLHIRASGANANNRILPGSFATVTIPLQVVDKALLIPTEAMTADTRGAKVYLYRGGKADPVMVQAGLRSDSSVQILKGLNPGDTLIISGIMQIRPGAAVTITLTE